MKLNEMDLSNKVIKLRYLLLKMLINIYTMNTSSSVTIILVNKLHILLITYLLILVFYSSPNSNSLDNLCILRCFLQGLTVASSIFIVLSTAFYFHL